MPPVQSNVSAKASLIGQERRAQCLFVWSGLIAVGAPPIYHTAHDAKHGERTEDPRRELIGEGVDADINALHFALCGIGVTRNTGNQQTKQDNEGYIDDQENNAQKTGGQ